MSDHKSLAEALLAFHKNPPHIPLDSTNPHFKSKFASLSGVMAAVRPRLAEEGIVIAQPLSSVARNALQVVDAAPAISTILIHAASGEQMDYVTPLLLGGKTDPQSHGSAITYARRYGVLAILALVGDEDDDGNAAQGDKQRVAPAGRGAEHTPPAPRPAPVSQKSGPQAPPAKTPEVKGAGVTDPAPPPADSGIPFGEDEDTPFQETFVPPTDAITDKQLKFLKMLGTKLIQAGELTVETFRAELDAQYGVTSTKALTKAQATEEIDSLKKRAIKAGLIEG